MRRFLLIGLMVLSTVQALWAAPSESLDSYAALAVPKGGEAAYKVVAIPGFGPAGARLALWKKADGPSPLHGLIAYLKGQGYTTVALPPQPYISWSVFEVKDVFVAKAAGTPLLFVRAEHVTGIGPQGAQPFSVTWVYRWTSKGTVAARGDLTKAIGQLESRKAILAKAHAKM